MIKPILTEKSLKLAKSGVYSFWLEPGIRKPEIKKLIGKIFDVHVVKVKTANFKDRIKRKKAYVTLAEKEKIDIFEVKQK